MHTIAEQFSTRFGARRFVRERHALVVSFAASVIAHAALIGVARWPELDRGLDALPVLTATLRHPAPVAPAAEPAREPAAAPERSPAVPPTPAVAAFESPGPPNAVAAPGAARAPAPPPSTATLPETAASYLSAPAPRYPLAARRDGIEGRVTVRVLVSAQGTPARVEIAQSSGSEILDRAAVQAVSAWRFAPARRGSQPVDAWVLVPVEFHLRSG